MKPGRPRCSVPPPHCRNRMEATDQSHRPRPPAMFCIAILFHDLGAYGFYQRSPFPWSFDIYVHYYFAIPVTLILHRAIATNFPGGVMPGSCM